MQLCWILEGGCLKCTWDLLRSVIYSLDMRRKRKKEKNTKIVTGLSGFRDIKMHPLLVRRITTTTRGVNALSSPLVLVVLGALVFPFAESLAGLTLCGTDSLQKFTYDASKGHIVLASDPTKCLQVATGCCNGELIRGGSYLELQSCMGGYESQKLSWPSASNNYTIRPLSQAGEPTVSVLQDNQTLVFDNRGYFFGGVQMIGGAFHAEFSLFSADADGRLISTSTGLCLTANMEAVARMSQPLNLQPCAPNKQLPSNGQPSTQLFSFLPNSRVLTSEGLCFTAEKPLADDVTGGVARLIGATCTGSLTDPAFVSQAFNLSETGLLTAVGLPGSPTADAGAANWMGARLPLKKTPPTPGGVFSFHPVNGSASLGTLVHLETGMCLDSAGVPEGQGCLDEGVRGLPFCNAELPLDARLGDLLARLTLSEATGFTGDDGENDSPCGTHTAAVPRLDISQYRWLVEVSSMASSLDVCSPLVGWHAGCPTSFPAAMLLTGSFNASLWQAHGRVVGDEMRAISNLATTAEALSPGRVSLAGHGPNINNPRDPRNGRNGELSSEDPFLSGAFAASYVRGMQFGKEKPRVNGTRRMLASLKHYTAYSRETDRMGSEGNVSMFDLWGECAATVCCIIFTMRLPRVCVMDDSHTHTQTLPTRF